MKRRMIRRVHHTKTEFIGMTILFVMMIALSGCEHQHVFTEATCTEPKTCSICGVTEGEARGHAWLEVGCDRPRTCFICGATEGEARGHTWQEADCDRPRTCSVCGATEGEALGHTWMEADCENPRTCSACGTTEGEALGHMVEVGLCGRCNTIQNKDLIIEIISHFTSMGEAANTMGALITSADVSSLNDVYTKINQAQSYLGVVTSNMQDAYDLCEGYADLHDIQNQAKYILDVVPEKVAGSDRDSIIASLSDYLCFLRQCQTTHNKIAEYARQLADGLAEGSN